MNRDTHLLPLSGAALALVICVVWGGNYTAAANGMQHFSPFLFMILRFLLLFALLFPFLRRPPPGQWGRLIAVCLFLGAFHFTLMFWAFARSEDVSSVAILQQTYIPIGVLLAMLLMRERVGWRTLAAVFISFVGVLVVGLDPLVLGQLDVLAIALASALFQALGSIYQRGLTGISPFNFQAWTAVIAMPVMVLASLLTEQGQLETLQTAELRHWASVLYSAVMASIVGHGLFFFLVQRHAVSSVMPYLQLTPIFGILFGIMIWGDRPGIRLLVGGTLVILGILLITVRAAKPRH